MSPRGIWWHLVSRPVDAEFVLIEERHRDQLERVRDAIRRNHASWDSLERTMRDGFARLNRSLDELEFRLDRETIIGALRRLAELLRGRGVDGEICLLEGAVMVLALSSRQSTKDVDAIFEPASLVRRLAQEVATERNLPEDWLNDGAKGFTDIPQFAGLRLTVPWLRIGAAPDDPGDVADIRFLIDRLGLTSAAQARAIVARYYPEERIPSRAVYLLDDIFAGRGATS